MPTTTKYALPYPTLATTPVDIPADFLALANGVDGKMVGYVIDTFANRPAASKAGRLFYSTDTNAAYLDTGSAWVLIGGGNRVGLLAAIPAATTVPVGTEYFATDQVVAYISDGTDWIRISPPAGTTTMQLGAEADSGYVLLQGQAWPGTTGIWADLHTKLGGSTLPDFRQRVPAGYKSADSDMGTLLATGGEKTHTLTIAEMPAHHHTYSHASGSQTGGGGGTGTPEVPTDTSDAGGGGAHNNLQPFIVVNFQAKL